MSLSVLSDAANTEVLHTRWFVFKQIRNLMSSSSFKFQIAKVNT
jgi:hypothetical protein